VLKFVKKSNNSKNNSILILVIGFLLVIGVILLTVFLPLLFKIETPKIPSIDFSKHDILRFEDDDRGFNNDSEIQFVYFSDFKCPYCIEQYPTIKKIIENYPNINFIHKNMVSPSDAIAFYASKAFECSNKQGLGYEMMDYLYTNEYKGIDIDKYAENIGIDIEIYKNCTSSEKIDRLIVADGNQGSFLEVKGTPTIFINGIKIEGIHDYDVYAAFLEQEISRLKKNKEKI